MTDLCFMDCETTGLHAELHKIWEFAGIRRTEEGEETRMLLQIEVPLDSADPFALSIGKFWERYGKNGEWVEDPTVEYLWHGSLLAGNWRFPQRGELVSPMVAAGLIQRFTHHAHVVGNCISFDTERMARLLYEESLLPTWHYHVQDIEPLIVGFLRGRRTADNPYPEVFTDDGKVILPYQSDVLTKLIGVPGPSEAERHTAMGDAEWVMRQWDFLFN